MTFTKIEGQIPEGRSRARNKLQRKLEEFVSMNTKIVKVDFRENEYVSPHSGYSSLYKACRIFCGPVKVIW